jgi:tRNA (cmo5U34)-methyltransferase
MRENRSGYRKRIDTIKGDFSRRSHFYDDYIVKVVPHHGEMLEALVGSIPFPGDQPIHILELGCGTGMATSKIMERYPHAHVKCIDMSPDMLDLAKKKLETFPDIEFILADYAKFKFKEKCDAVVSFLSLMYLADDRTRRSVFQKAYDVLIPGGAFVSGEAHASGNRHFQEVCMERWIHHMRRSYPDDFIQSEVLEKAEKHGSPSVLMDEVKCLEGIGFEQVDIFWKYYGFSVYGAIK